MKIGAGENLIDRDLAAAWQRRGGLDATIEVLTGSSLAPPRPEAYSISIDHRQRIVVAGSDPAGVYYGARALCRIIESNATDRLPRLYLQDWPDFAVRGAHLCLFRYGPDQKPNPAFWEALIERVASAEARLNTVVIQVDALMHYRKHPEIGQPNAFTSETLRNLCRLARARHITLVPHLQCLSHQGSLLARSYPAWMTRPGSETYRPEAPGLRPLLRNLMAELQAAFAPADTLHVGLDEVDAQAIPAEVFLRHVDTLYEDARHAGFSRIALWPDMLARYRLAPDRLPVQTTLLPWDYARRSDFPLLDALVGEGRSVWATGSAKYERDNLGQLARAAHQRGCAGLIASTWNSWSDRLVDTVARPLSGLLLAGEFGWNVTERPLGYDPMLRIRALLEGLSPVRPSLSG